MADPVVLDVPIAYIKRPLPLDDQMELEPSDLRERIRFDIGADLYLRDSASPSAAEVNLTEAVTQGLGDVRDPEASFDGEKLLFAMRAQFIEGADEEDQPTWNIWEYDLAEDVLRRIIISDITAEAGHDIAPHYLPDGRIIFASTRQRLSSAILLDEGKPQFPALDEDRNEFGFSLHVMNPDGSDIRQVSFNQSHDLDPVVLSDGKVAFSRWDNMGGRNGFNIYTMNPDGTDQQLLYGANSHATGTNGANVQFAQPRQTGDGNVMALLRPFRTSSYGGEIVSIDTQNFVEINQPLAENRGILTGPAQADVTINETRTDGSIAPGGIYGASFPLRDGTDRVLVSWSQCLLIDPEDVTLPVFCTEERLADPAFLPANPLFGIWIYDRAAGTQLPVVPPEAGLMINDIIALEPLGLPPVIYDKESTGELDQTLFDEGVGLLNIRSVYDVAGVDTANPDIRSVADPLQTPIDERPARFLRIVKAVSIPDDDVRDFTNTAFGPGNQGMREIIGYVPVEPDGSVQAKVPANVALAISVVDRNGRRTSARHQSWLQLRPGEVVTCHGCHTPASGDSHGRAGAHDPVYSGATTTGLPFPNTDPAIFADFGETMAEARGRISCATDCASIAPSVDVIFDDVWTGDAAAAFAYTYDDLDTPGPASLACRADWDPLCRTVINYETHIHPLWGLPRLAADGITDITCTVCHNKTDAGGMQQLPAGQLELSDGYSVDRPDYLLSYRELMFIDNEERLDMGAFVDVEIIIGTDPDTGDPITAPVRVGRPLSTAGSQASGAFFDRFAPGGTHEGYLTDHELRLVSEWIDIGGQYFNDPFAAPLD